MNRKLIILFITVLAVAAIIISLFQAGSPQQARRQQYDQQKLTDLQNLQQAITDYAYVQLRLSSSTTNLLPKRLTDLNNLNLGQLFLVDPMTNKEYGYRVIDNTHYELCAEFLTTNVSPSAEDFPGSWTHLPGYHCFNQVIDVEQLKINRGDYPTSPFKPVPVNLPD